MGVWPNGEKGTVLMFPGRTEYVEKYGRVAQDFANAGYGMVSFDWRGQGLADRPEHNAGMGHVESFDEYRQDVAAFVAALELLDLPKPWFLIGHSMGGCIGLRAIFDDLPVAAAAFTGPMWGVQFPSPLGAIAPVLLGLAKPLGLSKSFVPTIGEWEPMEFEGNILTTDPEQFNYMERQTELHPELTLGGPSYTWLKLAIAEGEALVNEPARDLPVVTLVGTDELRVSQRAPRQRMETWPKGELIMVEGGRHELLMEAPEQRQQTIDAILTLFDNNR